MKGCAMTRKDYIKLAAAIKKARQDIMFYDNAQAAIESVVTGLADALGDDNPRFDRERFVKACAKH